MKRYLTVLHLQGPHSVQSFQFRFTSVPPLDLLLRHVPGTPNKQLKKCSFACLFIISLLKFIVSLFLFYICCFLIVSRPKKLLGLFAWVNDYILSCLFASSSCCHLNPVCESFRVVDNSQGILSFCLCRLLCFCSKPLQVVNHRLASVLFV